MSLCGVAVGTVDEPVVVEVVDYSLDVYVFEAFWAFDYVPVDCWLCHWFSFLVVVNGISVRWCAAKGLQLELVCVILACIRDIWDPLMDNLICCSKAPDAWSGVLLFAWISGVCGVVLEFVPHVLHVVFDSLSLWPRPM